MIPDAESLVRISGALITAMTEARAMVDAGEFGPALTDLIRHANEMHELMMDELAAAGDAAGEYARGLAAAMGDKLTDLDRLMKSAHKTK